LPISSITKGVVFELNTFRANHKFLRNCFYEWLKLILDDLLPITPACIKAAVSRLSKRSSELSHNKHGDQIILSFKEPFFLPQSMPVTEQLQPKDDSVEMQHKVAKSNICARNVNKKLKCRDDKTKEYKSEISAISKENEVLHSCLGTAKRANEKNRALLN